MDPVVRVRPEARPQRCGDPGCAELYGRTSCDDPLAGSRTVRLPWWLGAGPGLCSRVRMKTPGGVMARPGVFVPLASAQEYGESIDASSGAWLKAPRLGMALAPQPRLRSHAALPAPRAMSSPTPT